MKCPHQWHGGEGGNGAWQVKGEKGGEGHFRLGFRVPTTCDEKCLMPTDTG